MTSKELRTIREAMGLTQAAFAERLRVSRNTVARIEVGLQVITPSMALLIGYVAREAGVDATHPERSRRKVKGKRKDAGKVQHSVRSHGRKSSLPR